MASQTSKPPSKPVLARKSFPDVRLSADYNRRFFVYGYLIITNPTGKSSLPLVSRLHTDDCSATMNPRKAFWKIHR